MICGTRATSRYTETYMGRTGEGSSLARRLVRWCESVSRRKTDELVDWSSSVEFLSWKRRWRTWGNPWTELLATSGTEASSHRRMAAVWSGARVEGV
jgi:hypothetical protein